VDRLGSDNNSDVDEASFASSRSSDTAYNMVEMYYTCTFFLFLLSLDGIVLHLGQDNQQVLRGMNGRSCLSVFLVCYNSD
jgi:hypothetical protein